MPYFDDFCSLPLTRIPAIFALAAGGLWLASALVAIPNVITKQFWGHSNVGVPGVIAALRRQARWSALAALAATVAAVAQGVDAFCR